MTDLDPKSCYRSKGIVGNYPMSSLFEMVILFALGRF